MPNRAIDRTFASELRSPASAGPVWITGIDGVYLLMAPEHDTLGPFGTLADAVDAMDRNFGEFLVGD